MDNGQNGDLTQKTKDWWNSHPFTYLMNNQEIKADWAFFRNIDRKIIKWMPWAQIGYPLLSSVVDYAALSGKKVLDIAIGTGWSTEQFVRAGAEVTAIDLTPRAVELTKTRLGLNSLDGAEVLVADAQSLPFAEGTFDYVLAFGCLMHMPDTPRAISEILRVLKKGGKMGAMMYNKNSLHWWYYIYLSKGILQGKLWKLGKQGLANRYTDGVYEGGNELTKFYTTREVKEMFKDFSSVSVEVVDDFTCLNHFPHRHLPLGSLLPRKWKQWLVGKVGQTLWIEAVK